VFNISKIQIESNSQLGRHISYPANCCVQYFKDTNREQFTTIPISLSIPKRLCSIFQRYKSRAIHNDNAFNNSFISAVFNISKIQIESNSQQFVDLLKIHLSCVQYFKDTNREQFTTLKGIQDGTIKLCSIFQRYKSRAIHNAVSPVMLDNAAVFNISKIQIESNSQRCTNSVALSGSCVQYFKDTNREQFTTHQHLQPRYTMLCSIFQRYKSRAIHNKEMFPKKLFIAVFNISKIQIESNSQLNQD